jgi:hypothetical protein
MDMKKLYTIFLIATVIAFFIACGSDSDDDTKDTDEAVGSGGSEDAGDTGDDPEFEACIENLQPICDVHEIDTEEEMEEETPCKDLKFIPIPLTDGGQYGPVTIESGPYGGLVMWNEGVGTEFANNVNELEPICLPGGVQTFNEPESVNAEILNTRGLDYSGYTIFRPACMKEGEKYPVITWANGTCGLTHGYTALLGTEASHGFVIVASNSTWTLRTTSPDGIPVQLRALDYAEHLNNDPDSVLYQKLDMEHIGAAGHSQGAGATAQSESDPRIDAIILWNGGVPDEKPFIYVSGDREDPGRVTADSLVERTDDATQPGAWVYYHQVLETGGKATGHMVLIQQPERVIDISVAWWKWQLKGDQEAKKMFVGDDCGLCNRDEEFEYGTNNLLE